MKVILISFIFAPIMLFSQSLPYKLAMKYEERGKSDKAIKWYLKSEKSIDPKHKMELYLKVYGLAIKLDTGVYGGRADYLKLAVKYHKKYGKLKSVNPVIKGEQVVNLKKEVKNEIVCMSANKKRSNALYAFYKENSNSSEDELILLIYDLSKIAHRSETEWGLFYETYFKVFQTTKNVDLYSKSKVIFDKILHEYLNESFLTVTPDITRKISNLEFFRNSYGLFLKNQVSNLYAQVERKSQDYNFEYLWKLWELEKRIYQVNPDLLDKEIFKISYLKRLKICVISQLGNGLNDLILNQNCNTEEDICFDTEPFYYDEIDELKGKPLVLNNQLLQLVFLHELENDLHRVKDWYSFNSISSVFKSDSSFRVINDQKSLKEHLKKKFNYYYNYATTCFEYAEFDKMLFADLLFQIARENILEEVNKKESSTAISKFYRSVQMFPLRNWSDQKTWFYNHFKNRLNLNETASMGKEIFIATHFFIEDKDFKVLIEKYRDVEYRVTLKNNNIKPDSWTGSTEICDCGTMSDEYMNAALESMKFYRRYTGLPDSIFFREKENRDAQCAALIMQAENDKSKRDKIYLDHHPKSTTSCFSAEGYYGASKGNLFYGTAMSGLLGTYIDDFGQASTGHRAWVLDPNLVSYGFGSTANANCLVWGGGEIRNDLTNFYKNVPFSWPPPGKVIDELIKESDNWTFALHGADFSNAVVKVFSDQKEVPIKIVYYQGYLNGGYGHSSYLNFNFGMEEVVERKKFKGGSSEWRYWRSKAIKGKTYEVEIDNVIDWYGVKRSFKYSVQII